MTLPAFAPGQERTFSHDPGDPTENRVLETEQAFLGAILFENEGYHRCADTIAPDDFLDPVHGAIYEAIAKLIAAGHLAEPLAICEAMSEWKRFQEQGALRYLADLVDRAPPAANAPDYARMVRAAAIRRGIINIADQGRRMAERDPGDPEELITAMEAELLALAERRRTTGRRLVDFRTALFNTTEMVAQAYQQDGGRGLSTGLMDLDRKLGGGLYPSDLIILAGRPSMGKTALATNIAFHAARSFVDVETVGGGRARVRGARVAFFSLEMSTEQLVMRILSQVTGVSTNRQRDGTLDANEFGALRESSIELQDIPLHIDDKGGNTLGKIASTCRRLKRRDGLDLVLIDYLQLIGATRERRHENRVQEVSEITQGLKTMAKELDVPVVALSQLSRKVEDREDKRPQLADLRESGSIEQDADVVIFVYREHYYLARAEPNPSKKTEYEEWVCACDVAKGKAEAIIGKQRHGPIGVVKLAFDENMTRFGDLVSEGKPHWSDQL